MPRERRHYQKLLVFAAPADWHLPRQIGAVAFPNLSCRANYLGTRHGWLQMFFKTQYTRISTETAAAEVS